MPMPYRSPEEEARSKAFWKAHDENVRLAAEAERRRDKEIGAAAVAAYKAKQEKKK